MSDQREYIIAKVEAQMRADGVDPEHLTLDQAWAYFCFNPDWDSREGHAGSDSGLRGSRRGNSDSPCEAGASPPSEPSPADIRKDVP